MQTIFTELRKERTVLARLNGRNREHSNPKLAAICKDRLTALLTFKRDYNEDISKSKVG